MNQRRGNVLLTMVLAMPLVVALTGCASVKIVRSSQQMCVAHGGQYSQETKQCMFAAATTVSGQKACEDLAGVYLPQVHACQLDK
jgi:hypothetical protein